MSKHPCLLKSSQRHFCFIHTHVPNMSVQNNIIHLQRDVGDITH